MSPGLMSADRFLLEARCNGEPLKTQYVIKAVEALMERLIAQEKKAAAPTTPSFGVWQPIETAPKDGSKVLIGWSCNGSRRLAWCISEKWQNEYRAYSQPTHWMPLPPAPQS